MGCNCQSTITKKIAFEDACGAAVVNSVVRRNGIIQPGFKEEVVRRIMEAQSQVIRTREERRREEQIKKFQSRIGDYKNFARAVFQYHTRWWDDNLFRELKEKDCAELDLLIARIIQRHNTIRLLFNITAVITIPATLIATYYISVLMLLIPIIATASLGSWLESRYQCFTNSSNNYGYRYDYHIRYDVDRRRYLEVRELVGGNLLGFNAESVNEQEINRLQQWL